MIVHDDAYYESRMPVKDLGPVKNFLRFIWDGERRAFLDRTARDWGLLGLFYLCFFGVLFSLFAIQMWITLHYISRLDKPYMQHSSQVARVVYEVNARSFFPAPFAGFGNPGLGFNPNILTPTTSPIIWAIEETSLGTIAVALGAKLRGVLAKNHASSTRRFLANVRSLLTDTLFHIVRVYSSNLTGDSTGCQFTTIRHPNYRKTCQ